MSTIIFLSLFFVVNKTLLFCLLRNGYVLYIFILHLQLELLLMYLYFWGPRRTNRPSLFGWISRTVRALIMRFGTMMLDTLPEEVSSRTGQSFLYAVFCYASLRLCYNFIQRSNNNTSPETIIYFHPDYYFSIYEYLSSLFISLFVFYFKFLCSAMFYPHQLVILHAPLSRISMCSS